MLTKESVSRLLEYDPITGIFLWHHRSTKRSGRLAGYRTKSGYIELSCLGQRKYAHRVAWLLTYGEWPKGQIDHINGIRDDNRIENLRVVSNAENHRNMKRHAKNSSGVTGVYWNRRAKKWQTYICIGGDQQYLGVFKDIDDAKKARMQAEKNAGFHKNHGKRDE